MQTTPGVTYTFRYRVKNIFGFSDSFSEHIEIKSAKPPVAPTNVSTQINGTYVVIQWTPSFNNYDDIIRFEIEI